MFHFFSRPTPHPATAKGSRPKPSQPSPPRGEGKYKKNFTSISLSAYNEDMSRFIFAFVLLIFSVNTASATGLLSCCDAPKIQKHSVIKQALSTMPPCHETGEKVPHQEKHTESKLCLCSSMCTAKIINSLGTMAFKAISFDLPVLHGEHDIAASIDRCPSTPPPKISSGV